MKPHLKAMDHWVISFPRIAAEWIERIGLQWTPTVANPDFICVWFNSPKAATFYMRRWNGRMGMAYVRDLQAKEVTA